MDRGGPGGSTERLTEYAIIAALVAIAAIGIVSLFGEQIEDLFAGKPPVARAAPAQTTTGDGGAAKAMPRSQ